MRGIEKECPYCGSQLAGHNVTLKEDGNIVDGKSSLYWCSSNDCYGIPGIARTFKVGIDGFLVECGVEDVEDLDSEDFDGFDDSECLDDEYEDYIEEYDDEYENF